MPQTYSESERRLRAAVRTFMSPGIWLLLGVQFLILFIFRVRFLAEQSQVAPFVRVALVSVLLAAFFYLLTGISQALTQSREAISISAAMRGAREVFARFMWLLIKAALLFVLALNILSSVVLIVSGLEPQVLVERYFSGLILFSGVLGYVFVFWRPLVFVKQEFLLLPSLISAVRILWNRLSHTAFLAFLMLTPTLVSLLLPGEIPVAAVLGVNLVDGLMGWIAYVYCVEWLQDQRE